MSCKAAYRVVIRVLIFLVHGRTYQFPMTLVYSLRLSTYCTGSHSSMNTSVLSTRELHMFSLLVIIIISIISRRTLRQVESHCCVTRDDVSMHADASRHVLYDALSFTISKHLLFWKISLQSSASSSPSLLTLPTLMLQLRKGVT